MVLVAKPMFWGMENHLGPFSEASDQPQINLKAKNWVEGLWEVKMDFKM